MDSLEYFSFPSQRQPEAAEEVKTFTQKNKTTASDWFLLIWCHTGSGGASESGATPEPGRMEPSNNQREKKCFGQISKMCSYVKQQIIFQKLNF